MAIPRDLAFDVDEYRTRLHGVRLRMAERDLDGLMLFGPHNICYLSGMDSENVFGSQALVVSLTDDPVLVLSHFEAGRAANTVWLTEVETYPGPNAVAGGPPPRPWRFDGGTA